MIMFMTVTTEDKSHLSPSDVGLIISLFLCIFFGFLMIFEQPVWLASIWLGLSTLCFISVYRLVYLVNINLKKVKANVDQDSDEYLVKVSAATRKLQLCNLFAFVMPLDALVYFLTLSGLLDYNSAHIGYLISDTITKVIFGIIVMESQTGLLHPDTLTLVNEKKANEARRNFLKYIFHEVRVPLNSIAMGIECLNSMEPADVQEYENTLLMMREASRYMSSTLNAVLNMQKIEEGKLELKMEPFDIRAALQSVTLTFSTVCSAKTISLLHRVRDDVPHALIGDCQQIIHVISNLISNAIKFSPADSEIVIDISPPSTFHRSRSTVDICVSVTDQGAGISEADQARLFDSFMLVRPGELQHGRGAGIGLSLCKQIVTLHGGSISCKSKLNAGSVFSFTIPLKVAPSLENQNAAVTVGSSPFHRMTAKRAIGSCTVVVANATPSAVHSFINAREYVSPRGSRDSSNRSDLYAAASRVVAQATVDDRRHQVLPSAHRRVLVVDGM